MLKSSDTIAYKSSDNLQDIVLEDILKLVTQKGTINLIKLPTRKKYTKKAIASTIDLEADKIIHILIQGRANNLKDIAPVKNKIIKPLYLFLNKEILLYAKLKRLKYKTSKTKQDKISLFIEDLEIKHPEVKRAVVNSYLELYT